MQHDVAVAGPSSQFVTPTDISPLLIMANDKTGNRGRKPGGANIITSSPYIAD